MPSTKPDSHRTGTTLGARSIGRAALVLRTLSTFGPRGAALKEIAAASGLPKATVHRILAALLEARLIERLETTRDYRLGPELFAFGATMAEVADLRGLARPSLECLAAQTGGVIYLGIRSGFDGLCLDRADGADVPADLALDVMDRWPLGVGVFSLVLLSFLPDAEIREIVEYNRRRLNNAEHFSGERMLSMITEVRKQGFAFQSMRTHRNLTGIAVPILDRRKRPIASLCVVGAPRKIRAQLETAIDQLLREADGISALYQASRRRREQREGWREWVGTLVERHPTD